MKILRKLFGDNKAATAIEYGLIAALIAVAGVAAFQTLGNQIGSTMNNAAAKMKTS
ncbi:Flp family type IVb pilin [Sphingobium boeckii]|uniref:Pilus assembly protein Flp/PilA n=1 Tax=Sphingobium boeckii TaxID=1082345 RepID=A0A7W9AK52_9SPHN|nr:Flp family type IVb pilin [Sphingobium boeckii]MBB5686971.1 pilus assembly protein Flp/PilA [Sphingobium boeckii]